MRRVHSYIHGETLADEVLRLIQEAENELVFASYVLSNFTTSVGGRRLLDLISQQLDDGVDVYCLLGRMPQKYVRDRLRELPDAIFMVCPRAHLKTVIADHRKGIISTGNITSRGTGMASAKEWNFEVAVVIDEDTTLELMKWVLRILHGDYCAEDECSKLSQGKCQGIQRVI